MVASHTGVFGGARLSFLPTNARLWGGMKEYLVESYIARALSDT